MDKLTTINEYEKKADKFLKKTGVSFSAKFIKHDKHFIDDKETRDIYKIVIKRGDREFKFNFGQSIQESGVYYNSKQIKTFPKKFNELRKIKILKYTDKEHRYLIIKFREWFCREIFPINGINQIRFGKYPSAYDILACLQKSDVGDFQEFCDNFGYNNDSIKAKTIYNAVIEEFKNVERIWDSEELEELMKIQ